MFCVASLTQLVWACLALVVAVASVGMAGIPFRYPLRRLAAMGTFLGMFLVVMPITAPARSGDTLIAFEHVSFISFNLRGFFLALLICLKASAIALMVEPLVATSSFSVTVQALARLRVPAAVCQMLLLAYRYIYVFQDEVGRMVKGMSARGFRKRTDVETLRSIGNFLGMLMVRSFERTQRVHDAMLARGYDGAMPSTIEFQMRNTDWMKGAFWVAAGIAILIADKVCRIAPLGIF
jgi:cobalt/nickel transport system permease protein